MGLLLLGQILGMKKILSLIFLMIMGFTGNAQRSSSAQILHELQKLQNPTRVLYLAAHPDDENTRLISWLVNEVGAHTAYLSLTRGDGGQNLIGTELGAKLGVLRTQELMQARHIDGGQQFFSRAVDFGYSKNARETLELWDEEAVLADVVWVIRKFRPDVIITRFPPDGRGGHGHHTASAMLGMKAFDLAADKNAYPGQLQWVDSWQPRRIYWNSSVWWNPDLDSIARNNPDYVRVDVGGYNAVTGLSNNELASLSRTQHKSQGFGVSMARGSQMEYLQYLKGEKAENGIFDGIDQRWERYDFEDGDEMLAEIIEDFDPRQPARSIPALLELREEADDIEGVVERDYFSSKLTEIILAAAGWHAELLAEKEFVQNGENLPLKLEAINRGDFPLQPKRLEINGERVALKDELLTNETYHHSFEVEVKQPLSQPYWLEHPYTTLFEVKQQQQIGKAENDPNLKAELILQAGKEELRVSLPVWYKFSDRVEGEIIRPVAVAPAVTVNPSRENLVFVSNEPQDLGLEIRFFGEGETNISLEAPGWHISPSTLSVAKPEGSDRMLQKVKVAPNGAGPSTLQLTLSNGQRVKSLTEVDYDHIDKRLVYEEAAVKLINLELAKRGTLVGYIPGAGDEVASAIEQMGYRVVTLDEKALQNQDLSQYQAIVAGIRAYNTQEWLPGAKARLMDYVQQGGNYIVQYNTASRDLLSENLGPYEFSISRKRVTEENAEAEFVMPNHPLLNVPNKLSDADFENWVQERGLYFADSWDQHFDTPLGWHDQGEERLDGALLVAPYGKGSFVYTGISFFRQLPAGVPGAYRLLANILSFNPSAGSNEQ